MTEIPVRQPVGMTGARVADIDVNPAEALLEVKNLRTSFGSVHAVDNVSFNVRRGEAVALVGRAAGREREPERNGLSAREREVLMRISRGESERTAARAMRLSAGALRTHMERILEELGCATRPAATLRALARGLI